MRPSAPYLARVLCLRGRSGSDARSTPEALSGPHLAHGIRERLEVGRQVPSLFDGDPMSLARGDVIRGGCGGLGGLTQEPAKKVDAVLVSFKPYQRWSCPPEMENAYGLAEPLATSSVLTEALMELPSPVHLSTVRLRVLVPNSENLRFEERGKLRVEGGLGLHLQVSHQRLSNARETAWDCNELRTLHLDFDRIHLGSLIDVRREDCASANKRRRMTNKRPMRCLSP